MKYFKKFCSLFMRDNKAQRESGLALQRTPSLISMRYVGKILPYILVPFLSVAIFAIFAQLWKIDLDAPLFRYDSDGFITIFVVKNIIETGWYLESHRVGLPHLTDIFRLYDFPIQSDTFHLLLIKFFSYFSDNPFRVVNYFFLFTFFMVSATAFIVLREFEISVFIAGSVAILYAFTPFHFGRNTWHLFFSNYMIVPLSIMVGMWIILEKITIFGVNKKGQYSFDVNKYFFYASAIAAFLAINNVYFGFYSAAIFMICWFLRGLNRSKFFGKNGLDAIILSGIIFLTLISFYLPTLFYQMEHGKNPMVAGRSVEDSEFYGLKIIDLLLPVANHYIDYFAILRLNFIDLMSIFAERYSQSLGLVGSISFLFLLFWLLGKNLRNEKSLISQTIHKLSLSKKEQDLISYLAGLNIFLVLLATTGGFIMLFSIVFPVLRSHCRVSIFIAFICMTVVALICDKIVEKKFFDKKIYAKILVGLILLLALFDQVGRTPDGWAQNQEMLKRYYNDRDFIELLEASLPEKSVIFILPVHGFPEQIDDDYHSIIAYANSKTLRWSYPSIVGRESYYWQKKVATLHVEEFIAEIKKAGFAGIYLNRAQFYSNFSFAKLSKLESGLKENLKTPPLISRDKNLVFFKLN